MEDIAPGLLASLRKSFAERIEQSGVIDSLYKRIESGSATYAEAEDFAYEVGKCLAETFKSGLSSSVLPDGKMYYNIADRVIRPLLSDDHTIVSDAAAMVQKSLNKGAGIGLQAKKPKINEDRVAGIIDKVSDADQYDDVAWVLDAPVVNFSQSVVDDILKHNVEFHGRAGLTPKIIRKAERKCCKWCKGLAGKYEYPDVPHDVYRRHENCRCAVLYDPADGSKKRQNVHSREWTDSQKRDKIKTRKLVGRFSESKRRYEPDIFVAKGVGAKQKDILVKLPNGQRVTLTPGSRITNVQTIAGLGRKRQIDMVDLLVERYPGSEALKWQKKKGIGYVDFDGESYKAELHWYEEPSVGKVEFKIKPDADGNWFYED